MENGEKRTGRIFLRYEVDDNPKFGSSVLLGFQNILTAFSGIVAVPLIIAGIAGVGVVDSAYLVSAALLASGISSIIQTKGFGEIYARGRGVTDDYGYGFRVCTTGKCDYQHYGWRFGRLLRREHFRCDFGIYSQLFRASIDEVFSTSCNGYGHHVDWDDVDAGCF